MVDSACYITVRDPLRFDIIIAAKRYGNSFSCVAVGFASSLRERKRATASQPSGDPRRRPGSYREGHRQTLRAGAEWCLAVVLDKPHEGRHPHSGGGKGEILRLTWVAWGARNL